ncbi:MAG: GAF domain-containing sensor histidine kinase [Bacteroidales bacterium]|nr:GAF domain-containing sensor histidine kinase [Bacteroidales bacterium]
MRSKERFLSHLIEITRLGLRQSSIPDLFHLLANHMHKLLLSDDCYITLWDKEKQETVPLATSGLPKKDYMNIKSRPGEQTLTSSALKAGKPLVVENVHNTPYLSPRIAKKFATQSALALPLIVDENKLGAVIIGYNTPHKFTSEEVEYGAIAADHIALVVHKAKLVDELLQSKEDLIRANAEKDKFFSIIAHDLRSPFSALQALTNLLVETTSALTIEEIREHAISIDQSAKNIYKLLENLLEWAQFQGGRLKFNPECVFLDKVIKSCVNTHKVSGLNKNINIETDVPERIIVFADLGMLTSVINNLLNNALKFTQREGRIIISAHTTDTNMAMVKVEDNGTGMSEELLQNLFHPDKHQFLVNGTEGETGAGLGLLICKDFVEKHKGSIRAESTPDKGSRFYFTLPLATPDCL